MYGRLLNPFPRPFREKEKSNKITETTIQTSTAADTTTKKNAHAHIDTT